MDVLHPVEHWKFTKGCAVTPEFIGVAGNRDAVLAQKPGATTLGSLGVPVPLKARVQNDAMLIHGPP